MTTTVFFAVMLGAVLHAAWNAIVKSASDKFLTTLNVTAFAAVIAAASLPWLPVPARSSWAFIAGSVFIQFFYYHLIARIYHVADMSLAYPLMRGTAPLLVALTNMLLLKDAISPLAWVGIGVISTGIMSMALEGRRGSNKGIAMALLNACVIAAYTSVDGIGVRHSGAPLSYTLWIFLLNGVTLLGWTMIKRGDHVYLHLRRNWTLGIAGGVASIASYGLALWAMTTAPVATIAALRETSILFGAVISAWILKEGLSRSRILAACLIAAGAAIIRSS